VRKGKSVAGYPLRYCCERIPNTLFRKLIDLF
jgi:hypothetical protein